jgi:hypothetical protein
MKIAILGWGSLLWDVSGHSDFDDQLEDWNLDGPELPLEFSRISRTRLNALTLVIDAINGTPCKVAYAMSKRNNPDDAICDLRSREGTILRRIGYHFLDGTRDGEPDVPESIKVWCKEKGFDVVIWTGLSTNFPTEAAPAFSVDAALAHLRKLSPEGKAKAAEYIWRAPDFIKTQLRDAVQIEPWFSGN